MFSQLLASLQSTIKQAKQTIVQTSEVAKQSKKDFNYPDRKEYHDPTKTYGKTASFSKKQRFKPLVKEEPKTTDMAFSEPEKVEKQKIKANVFGTSSRFQKTKAEEKTVLNPNYDSVKKNNKQAPVIKPDYSTDMEKSRLTQATTTSFSDVGPGAYFVQSQESSKNGVFSKAKRFEKIKQNREDTPLYPSETLTKRRPPSAAVMKKRQEKTKNIISKEQQQQMRQRLKMVYWKSIPLQLDRIFKKNNGPIIREKYFDLKKLTRKERKCAIMMLLQRLNMERGGFQQNIATKLDKNSGVVYRKSTPKPFKFPDHEPGPDYYYPFDDAVRPTPIVFSFGKKQEQKKQQIDHRDYEIDDNIFKKGGNIVINPEHKPRRLTEEEIRSLNRGPGFYDCLFSQVEKRDDVGIVKFPQLNQKNARENNCVEVKEVNDGIYYPSYVSTDTNVSVPLYKQATKVKPAHTPDRQMFPEHWVFYDGDLNKVRAEIAKNVLLANNMGFNQYKLYKKQFDAFKKFIKNREKHPQALDYLVKYDQVDPHIEGFDLAKKQEKTLIEPIIKEEGHVPGDNLLLQAKKPEKKLADFDFGKMVGRQENQLGQDEVKEGDRLILQPKLPQKKIGDIKFQKMIGRQEQKERNIDEEPEEGDRVILNPKPIQKHLPNIDFGKQVSRPEIKNQVEDGDRDQIVLNPHQEKKIKGFVQMQRMSSVRLVPYLRKKHEGQQQSNN